MPMFSAQIVPMAERKYRMVPVAKVQVLNSREREQEQFSDNIRSIESIGLLKPIVVNERPLKKSGHYEIVCGEGRYLAFKKLGRKKIPAEVIDCDRKTALLYSLVENIARVPPNTMWFAREMKRMKDSGLTTKQLCQIVGKTETYICDYIGLVELGEERLIKGVEQGIFSMTFATIIAKSSTAVIQNVLMDAFDEGIVNCQNFARARSIINARFDKRNRKGKSSNPDSYTVKSLVDDITNTTKVKDSYVREARKKENRLLLLLDSIETLFKDKALVDLLRQEALVDRPGLLGTYHMAEQA
jgi:ParB family chromosome partitioning protein